MSVLKKLPVKLEEVIEDKKVWVNPNPTNIKKTATEPDLLVYGASGVGEPNFRIVVPSKKGFMPTERTRVKIINPQFKGFMFDEGVAGVKDSTVVFADSVEEIK
ncbi:hypothetical protein P7H38_10340 [Lactococcus raffinolactis]|uniref:hypothetical protein n=1 Tax=Pseudolactococcus raffinolactis TaxID=1366 RepID=UPI0028912280|nr:hypothetical protein [Lactococcus raffinolactis]MDT2767073.1 hypothetical protein [Lactococcus raffinolactis]MDT2790194.1 hypothetical protein [Lactococcus raffinolactis]